MIYPDTKEIIFSKGVRTLQYYIISFYFACQLNQISEEHNGSMVECLTRESEIEGLWVPVSPEALCCVLEQDFLSFP